LSHFFYRAFLKHIYGGFEDTIANKAQEMASLRTKYDRIFLKTDVGVVKSKGMDGNTHKTCVNSLLCTYINQAIHAVTDGHEYMPVWSSEFALFDSAPAIKKQNGAAKKAKNLPRGDEQSDEEGFKQPRCSGIMVMPDPPSRYSL